MIKKFLFSLLVLLSCQCAAGFAQETQRGVPIYKSVYPDVEQLLMGTDIFWGDRHNEFEGDYVAYLSDGSGWKIHPEDRSMYEGWFTGDVVRIKLRTDWYWFKREHKFHLYNMTRGQSARVMLVKPINNPYPLTVVGSETYAKSSRLVPVPTSVYNFSTGRYETVTTYRSEPCNFRKIISLSDGSYWVIKDKFALFTLGSSVCIGAQGSQTDFYDFVFIVGDQREAQWTMARPQR